MNANLRTRYMGFDLVSPVVVSSSGLTQTVNGIRQCESAGAGAVVLKSIFEEQIEAEIGALSAHDASVWAHPEATDYIRRYGREHAVSDYLDLISSARRSVDIPVIASIHCVSSGSWVEFARRAQDAGASGIELNVFIPPMDPSWKAEDIETLYFSIADSVKGIVSIPVAMKVGPHFTAMSRFLIDLGRKVDGLVLFNRFFPVDIDIENMSMTRGAMMSAPDDISLPLRWVSILSGRTSCDFSLTSGVHDGAGVVKALLAGAKSAQMCSRLYRDGVQTISTVLADVGSWMEGQGFKSVDDFCGKLVQKDSANPGAFERFQFMQNSVGLE